MTGTIERPKVKLELTRIDLVIEVICALGLVIKFIFVLLNYRDLPEILPQHYNFNGMPDGFGAKPGIWFLPVTTLVLYVVLTILTRFPHIYNYQYPITPDNAKRQYKNATMMLRILKTMIVFNFLYMTYATVKIASADLEGLGKLFAPISLVIILGTVGVFTYRGFKLR